MSFATTLRYGIFSQGVSDFSPDQIDGLVVWYGDNVNDGTDRTTLSDGTAITQWDDQSGNDYHVTPTNDSPVVSGNSIYFAGSNNRLKYTGTMKISGTTSKTEFISFLIENTTSTQYGTQYGTVNSTGKQNSFSTVMGGSPIGDGTGMFMSDYRGYYKYLIDSNGDGWIPSASYIWTKKNPDNFIGNEINRINGTGVIQNSGNNGYYDFGNDLNVGGWYDNSRQFKGKLFEYIAYNRALTTEEIEQVEDYLNNKYNIY